MENICVQGNFPLFVEIVEAPEKRNHNDGHNHERKVLGGEEQNRVVRVLVERTNPYWINLYNYELSVATQDNVKSCENTHGDSHNRRQGDIYKDSTKIWFNLPP